jgi:NAD+ kinase
MSNSFNTIGLIGRQRKEDISDTLLTLKNFLQARKLSVLIETETASYLPGDELPVYPRDQLGKHCDLIIVVGGDGSLLNAARAAVNCHTPVLGINRGRFGFLTDILPGVLTQKIAEVLDGRFTEEQRFLLNVDVEYEGKTLAQDIALNDVVLMPGEAAHMIEFATTIDGQFMSSQYADGLIIATPTGSTAYALSGGGPILHPSLDAVVLVPMFPHTLSARPIVIAGDSVISIEIVSTNENAPGLSCDGQARISVQPGATINVSKKPEQLRLIHPVDYNYFETLRAKLHWSTKL